MIDHFRKKAEEKDARERYLTDTYVKLSAAWNKRVERAENNRKRKERDAKSRELYEKIFPELRKQREDKERDHRLGTRGAVRSEADIEDVIERLQEQEVSASKKKVSKQFSVKSIFTNFLYFFFHDGWPKALLGNCAVGQKILKCSVVRPIFPKPDLSFKFIVYLHMFIFCFVYTYYSGNLGRRNMLDIILYKMHILGNQIFFCVMPAMQF